MSESPMLEGVTGCSHPFRTRTKCAYVCVYCGHGIPMKELNADWVDSIRSELLMSKATHSFTFSRDEVVELLGGWNALAEDMVKHRNPDKALTPEPTTDLNLGPNVVAVMIPHPADRKGFSGNENGSLLFIEPSFSRMRVGDTLVIQKGEASGNSN